MYSKLFVLHYIFIDYTDIWQKQWMRYGELSFKKRRYTIVNLVSPAYVRNLLKERVKGLEGVTKEALKQVIQGFSESVCAYFADGWIRGVLLRRVQIFE